ncbi:MAG: penicillin-binding transpeptidase domain-containing protein [Planctomycetota bacterium]
MQRVRIIGIALVVIGLSGVIAARLIWMQGLEWREYRAIAERTRRSTHYDSAPRGRILDVRGRVLAEDQPTHAVAYSLRGVIKTRWVARRVHRLLRDLDRDGGFPYDEERLFRSLETIRKSYGVRLGGEVELPPRLWIENLTPEQAAAIDRELQHPKRSARYPGLTLRDGRDVWVMPQQTFAGEAGIRRLERRIREVDPERRLSDLFVRVEEAYTLMRNPVRQLEAQLERVLAQLEAVDDIRNTKERAEARRELWDRRDQIQSRIADRDQHSQIRQRLYERVRPLASDVPYEVVAEIAESPGLYPGLIIEERKGRRGLGGIALSNLIGSVGPRTAEIDREWAESGQPVIDSWYPHHGRLQRIQDPRTFLAVRDSAHHSEDLVGIRGLERMLEPRLRGVLGARNQEVDVRGQARRSIWEEPPSSGEDVRLTIDQDLCDTIYEFVAELDPFGASVLIGDPRTGDLHAWVSYPALDPNATFRDQADYESFLERNRDRGIYLNRPTQSDVEPGSTFKTVVAIAGLAEGLITPHSDFTCTGVYNPNKPDELTCRNHSLGLTLDVREALARSCNCFFYTLGGDDLGTTRLREWGERLHLWDRIGNGFRGGRTWGEPPYGRERDPQAGIGRGFIVRPIGMYRLVCGIANRGRFAPARLLADAPLDPGEQLDLDPVVWETVVEGMKGAVDFGSASSARVGLHRFDCAAKTGTAETRWRERQPDGTNKLVIGNTAWLIGFAPVDNPKVAFAVCVERAADGDHGGDVCGPIVARALDWLPIGRGISVERPR